MINTVRLVGLICLCVAICSISNAQMPPAFAGTRVVIATPGATDSHILMSGTYDWSFPSQLPTHTYSCYQTINIVTLTYLSRPSHSVQSVISTVRIPGRIFLHMVEARLTAIHLR